MNIKCNGKRKILSNSIGNIFGEIWFSGGPTSTTYYTSRISAQIYYFFFTFEQPWVHYSYSSGFSSMAVSLTTGNWNYQQLRSEHEGLWSNFHWLYRLFQESRNWFFWVTNRLSWSSHWALYGNLPLPVDGSQYNNLVKEHQGKRFMKVARKAVILQPWQVSLNLYKNVISILLSRTNYTIYIVHLNQWSRWTLAECIKLK